MTEDNQLEPSSLAALLLSMATTALAYLGRAVLPGADKPEVNLPLAKHVIDTLAMLETKTEGNRTPDESALLRDLLHDLRLVYLKAESAPAAPPSDTGTTPEPPKPTS